MIVTVDEVKTHLRIQHDEEDDYIESLIKQAQTAAEDYCRVQFEPVDEEGAPIETEVPEPVRMAISAARSGGKQKTPVEMQQKATERKPFCATSARQLR